MEIISRKEAKEKGLKRYFTGKPCLKGHVSLRVTTSQACVSCRYASVVVTEIKRVDALNRSIKSKANIAKRKAERLSRMEQEFFRFESNSISNRKVAKRFAHTALKSVLLNQDNFINNSKALGYSHSDLKSHIESKFKDGMSWENRSEWHIDHIKPIKAFLDEGITDPKIINALDNLQPLWARENLEKGAKYDG